MPEKYNEDILVALRAEQAAINAKINNLIEFMRNAGKYKDDAKAALKATISSDSEWSGNKKPTAE
tara:strand:+ start:122 stop:316 length:195 start_codon:yes stop_codon:yes gene_type:complete